MISPAFIVVFLAASHANAIKQKVTPVEKVITLLEKLKAETAAEAQSDAATYDKMACFCKQQADDKLYAITKSKEKIEEMKAKIELLTSEIDGLNAEIQDLKAHKEELEEEQKVADGKRADTFEAYAEEAKKLSIAIAAVEGAIKALEESKEGMVDAKLNLAQVKQTVSQKQYKEIEALMAMASAQQSTQKQPAYKYASNDIIATLKGLLKTFKQNKVDVDTEEADSRNQYDMEKNARENTIEFTGKDIDEKSALVSSKEKEKQKTEQLKGEEQADANADQEFLNVLTETCEQQAKDFDQRSNARTGEITAITKAIEILKSGVQPNYGANGKLTMLQASKTSSEVKDHHALKMIEEVKGGQNSTEAKEHSVEPVAEAVGAYLLSGADAPASFMQVRSKTGLSMLPKAVTLLNRESQRLHSPILAVMAIKVGTGSGKDHFVKVRGMIKDLIAKLEQQAKEEANQKSFCDKEMGLAIDSRDEANGKVETLTANIDSTESDIAKLTEEITELGDQIAELRKGVFEATELRADEKADNEKTLADSEAGLEAVKAAIKVLKEFYEGAFTQFTPAGAGRDGKTVADMAPAGQTGEYHGNKDAAAGIFGLLEVIQSDFERTIKKTSGEEEKAAEEHEKFEEDTKASIDEKGQNKKQAEEDKKQAEADLIEYKDELLAAQQQLQDAKDELEKLKPLCVDTGESWEEKRARQKEEIEALKEALAILSEV